MWLQWQSPCRYGMPRVPPLRSHNAHYRWCITVIPTLGRTDRAGASGIQGQVKLQEMCVNNKSNKAVIGIDKGPRSPQKCSQCENSPKACEQGVSGTLLMHTQENCTALAAISRQLRNQASQHGTTLSCTSRAPSHQPDGH